MVKLSFRIRTFLLYFVVFWFTIHLVFTTITGISGWDPFGDLPGKKGVVALFAFTAAYGIVAASAIVFGDKGTRIQCEIMSEFENRGYTDRFLTLCDQEIKRLIATNSVYSRYRPFSQYVLLRCDGLLNYGRVYEAAKCIDLININDILTHLKGAYSVVTIQGYFNNQMDISAEPGDVNRANAVLEAAKPYIKTYRDSGAIGRLMEYELYALYYLAIGDYQKGLLNAQAMIAYSKSANAKFSGNYQACRICLRAGDYSSAKAYLAEAEANAKRPSWKNAVDYMKKCMQQVTQN